MDESLSRIKKINIKMIFLEQIYLGRYDLSIFNKSDSYLYLESIWDNKVLYFSSRYNIPVDEVKNIVYQFRDYKNRFPQKSFQYVNDLLGLNISRPDDITQYNSFKEIKDVVLTFKSIFDTRSDLNEKDVEIDEGLLLYRDEHIEIYRALSPHACILIGQNDKWCISREKNNFFYNYRFNEEQPTFYFIKNFDLIKDSENEKHALEYSFFVLSVLKDSEEKNRYKITTISNDKDSEVTWEKVVQICPHLKNKKHFFVSVSLSEKEKVLKDKFYKKSYTIDEFRDLSYTSKELFLDLNIQHMSSIPDEFWNLLPKELKKKYILMQGRISEKMLIEIAKDKELNAARLHLAKNILIRLPKNIDEYIFYFKQMLFSGFSSEQFLSNELIKNNKKSLAYLVMFFQDDVSLKSFISKLDFTNKEDADLALDVFNFIKDENLLSKYTIPYLSNIITHSSALKLRKDEIVLPLFIKFYGIESLPKDLPANKLSLLLSFTDTDVFFKKVLPLDSLTDSKKIKALFDIVSTYTDTSLKKEIFSYLKRNIQTIILNADDEDIPVILETCSGLLNEEVIKSVVFRLRKIKKSSIISECLVIQPISILLLRNKVFDFSYLKQEDLIDIIYADVNATVNNFCLTLLKKTLKEKSVEDFSTIKDLLSTSSAVKIFNLFQSQIKNFSNDEKLELLKLDIAPLLIKKIPEYKSILSSVNDFKVYVNIFHLDKTLENPLFQYLWKNGYIKYEVFPKTAYFQISEKYNYNPLKLDAKSLSSNVQQNVRQNSPKPAQNLIDSQSDVQHQQSGSA